MNQKEALLKIIEAAGSASKLSELSGVPGSRISEWLNGKHKIRYDVLLKLASAINLKINITS